MNENWQKQQTTEADSKEKIREEGFETEGKRDKRSLI